MKTHLLKNKKKLKLIMFYLPIFFSFLFSYTEQTSKKNRSKIGRIRRENVQEYPRYIVWICSFHDSRRDLFDLAKEDVERFQIIQKKSISSIASKSSSKCICLSLKKIEKHVD